MVEAASPLLRCPECGSTEITRNGNRYLSSGEARQRWKCKKCTYRFSEKRFSDNAFKECRTENVNRQVCAVLEEAKNLSSAQETKTCAGERETKQQDAKGKILQFALYLKLQNCSEHTIKGWSQKLRRLADNADLEDPESVKRFLASLDIAESSKHAFCVAYTAFLKWQGKSWTLPKYKGTQKIPEFIPTEQEIDALIAGCGKKTAAILQVIKETGMRIGECLSLKWSNINPEAHTITLNTPEKNSNPRIFKVSAKLIGMLQSLPKVKDEVFGKTTPRNASICLAQQRKKIARKLANPRIAKIHFHLIRHWKGTMEYHKTQNIIHVQKLLGHKSILNTQLYVNLEQAIFTANEDYEVKAVETLEEAVKLLEVGFEYVTDMDGKKLFRKRK
ncbi:MAG: tyrosine-type recombinase/integrase [Candidatus Bathyarchaeia archaeon]